MPVDFFTDSNLVLALSQPTHLHPEESLQAVTVLLLRGDRLFISPQVVYEFWSVASKRIQDRGLGLTTAQCAAQIASLEITFQLVEDNSEIYLQWKRLVELYGVSGKPTHDARLAAAMKVHGLSRILTFNGDDFKRYTPEGIVVVDPTSVSSD